MNRSKIYLTEKENARILEIIQESLEKISQKDWSIKCPSQMFQALSDSISTKISRETVIVSQK